LEKARVLIVSEDAEFANALVQSWQRSSCTPEFAVSSVSASPEFPESTIAVIDGLETLTHWSSEVPLAIAVTRDEPLPQVATAVHRVIQIRRSTGWADIAAALASETVLRMGALQRVMNVEHQLRESERYAALGRFIAGERHGLGNALTCVLGNSELVLLELDSGLRDEARGQLETIHAMSLKIHETLQRLSSLDMEMQLAERQAQRENLRIPAKAVAPQ
jgi:signal transduction histidine kinase